jgi:hypothetical protein
MKEVLIQLVESEGHQFGPVSDPTEIMKIQTFIHARINDLIRDCIVSHKFHQVSGFDYALGGGNAFNISISKPGIVYATNGKSYELLSDTALDIAAADPDLPRIDVVIAVLEESVDAELQLKPFVRLRTADEFADSVSPYAPQNIMAATELHNRAVIQIKTGTPATVPALPTLNSNELPLYLISVAAGALQIHDSDVGDMRELVDTMFEVGALTKGNNVALAQLLKRMEAVEQLAGQPIDLSQVFGDLRSLGDILTSLKLSINALRDIPEIRYGYPKVSLTDPDSSKIRAAGNVDTGVAVVDIEIGGVIDFGDTQVVINPDKFSDNTIRARFAQTGGGSANVRESTDLNLNTITQIAADGFTDFAQREAVFDAFRARPACAAIDDQFIAVYGGLASNNLNSLGDLLKYDVLNDTLTPQEPNLALPDASRPSLFSYGDGTHVLLIAGDEGTDAPRCFKIDGSNSHVTEITTTKPSGTEFFGDLIAPNKILVVALRKESSGTITDFWEFNTGTSVFTQLGVTGSVPSCEIGYASGCHLDTNQFLLVSFAPGAASSGKTYIFNRTTLQWTQLLIAAPYGGTSAQQRPLSGFQMANINGVPTIVGAGLQRETLTNASLIWSFQRRATISTAPERYQWNVSDATFPPLREQGFCSSLGLSNMTDGGAVLFAGLGKYSDAKGEIFTSIQGGIIATTDRGQPAITLADSSTFAQFVIPVYTADWTVLGYLASPAGKWTDSNLKIEVSFDNQATWQIVMPDRSLPIGNSASPGVRHLRITMYNLKTSKPVLSKLVEVFDENGNASGQLEGRIVIRYNAPDTVKALYIDRDGVVTQSASILPSTAERCLLHKVTPTGPTTAPTIKNYINRRRPHIKYTGTKGASPPSLRFDNELAVPVRYINAVASKVTSGDMYKIAEPTPDFDATVSITGVVSTGDNWYIELEG